ncbi:MarR family winged helix-turn-helix transcriptional regulator [Oceanibacterium hippocampi]|uniref:HTH-type transcriptional repressor NicR n=1 Tax=Oceanibacterium hippocampi TaxID=745714 RepID=A0A1Y5SE65_9PROT|nr:MarR family winged helix-turn-helix transcriptional regulator [Oceanibacterium hippocampi]SLN38649.1 HTH-type transcriptional repressor NicR [Oceanibacterium hippocampi]
MLAPGETVDDDAVSDYRLEKQVGHLLRRAHQRATSIFLDGLGDGQVTPTQYAALVRLAEQDDLSQNHLGRLTAMDPATAQGVIRRLGDRGLIETRRDPDDRRRTRIRLTDAGRRLVAELIPRGAEVSARTLEPLDAAEQRLFLKFLERLC